MSFLLLMLLFRSVCHQVSNQADKLVFLAIYIISPRFAHLFKWASSGQCFLTTYNRNVFYFICSLFYSISSRYLTIFVHFYVGFTLFIVLLYFIISQRFSFYTSTIFLWHAVSHSYNVMVSFAFLVFVRHTAHCFLLLVSCMLYVVKKHCLEEAHLNRWAKRQLIQ